MFTKRGFSNLDSLLKALEGATERGAQALEQRRGAEEQQRKAFNAKRRRQYRRRRAAERFLAAATRPKGHERQRLGNIGASRVEKVLQFMAPGVRYFGKHIEVGIGLRHDEIGATIARDLVGRGLVLRRRRKFQPWERPRSAGERGPGPRIEYWLSPAGEVERSALLAGEPWRRAKRGPTRKKKGRNGGRRPALDWHSDRSAQTDASASTS